MTLTRFAIALTLVNFVTLALLVMAGTSSRAADDATPLLRTQAIELVDARGLLRASLKLEGDGVLLRMMDQRGEIRVKLGADRKGSALVLGDDTAQVGVHLLAGISALTDRRDTKLVLGEPGGAMRVFRATDSQR